MLCKTEKSTYIKCKMTLIQINLTYEHTCKEFYWFTRVKINEKQEFVFMCSRSEQKKKENYSVLTCHKR